MTLLVIADDDSVVGRILETQADLLVSCGDLLDDTILGVASRCGCTEILAVRGNHDSSAPFKQPIRDLHLTTFTFRGTRFGGFCGSWKYKPKGHYLFEEFDVERSLANFPAVDVFVAHNSPRHIHDREDEVHIGFAAFNTYLERCRPKLFLHGHQHQHLESMAGVTRVIGTYGHRALVVPD